MIKAFLQIIRPFNCFFTALCVVYGAMIKATVFDIRVIILSALAATFIAAGGYVLNDYYDLEIDKINRKDRVLPSGKISPGTALKYAWILMITGFFLSVLTWHKWCIIIAVVNTLLLVVYAGYLKKTFLLGNLLIAYSAASTFFYGAIANDNVSYALAISFIAFTYTLIREIIKDTEDVEGDMSQGAKTIPIVMGKTWTFSITFTLILAMGIGVFSLFWHGMISMLTFNLLNIFTILPLLISYLFLNRNVTKKNLNYISNLMKLNMFFILIIMWIGK